MLKQYQALPKQREVADCLARDPSAQENKTQLRMPMTTTTTMSDTDLTMKQDLVRLQQRLLDRLHLSHLWTSRTSITPMSTLPSMERRLSNGTKSHVYFDELESGLSQHHPDAIQLRDSATQLVSLTQIDKRDRVTILSLGQRLI